MAQLNETPQANRVRIAFFGLRNAGKSTLVNAFTGQDVAIVSDTPGTTTDPVSKAMEILPLGACLVVDTAGLDDEGALGEMRVRKTLGVLETADIAVWVASPQDAARPDLREAFLAECRRRRVVAIDFARGDSVEGLKAKIAAVKVADAAPGLLDGLAGPGDRVVCVCPIDE
ncbi:MAG: 50S ribosome-binding GTPase, partial [Kiritimatiellae bacterium]|nr:50S ribosome-binding GTPase [Kiritimatiellia bacterium]